MAMRKSEETVRWPPEMHHHQRCGRFQAVQLLALGVTSSPRTEMHRGIVVTTAPLLHFASSLVLVLVVSHVVGDWVEIPYLQPKTTTQRTTVIRKTVSQLHKPEFIAGSSFLSEVLPQTSSGESDRSAEESHEEYPESDHHRNQFPIPGNRFPHGSAHPVFSVSDLMDYEEFVESVSTTTEKPVVNHFGEEPYESEPGGTSGGNLYGNFQKRFYEYPRVNVSNKVGWATHHPVKEQHLFVTANRNPATPFPSDHQPLSNKYEEESIEYLHTDSPPHRPPEPVPNPIRPQAHAVNDRVELITAPEDDQAEISESSSEEEPAHSHVLTRPSTSNERDFNGPASEKPAPKPQFPDFDDYDVDDQDEERQSFRNSSVKFVRRKRPGQITIVKIIPPRRRFRPLGEGGGFSGFLKFIKRMQDGFMLNTAKNIGDKIKLLQNLKDQLLLSIESKMSTLWGNSAPPDKPEKVGHPGVVTKVNRKDHRKKDQHHRRRTKRGGDWLEEVHTHHHGGMEFPSAEAALLTISFLTFAVFLIKLVLQVINTIKAKHYTYTTLNGMTPVSTATLKLVKRTKRSEDALSDQHLNILSAINSYKFTGN
ncbi:hypothetical protein pipiens_016424 [Culex pipiens pipiens]|uniref:Uncharacterized protein n=1 Tax=Culex pipiens pipiens TaxID=38569 RepID=A0ABD1CMA8_CULPP